MHNIGFMCFTCMSFTQHCGKASSSPHHTSSSESCTATMAAHTNLAPARVLPVAVHTKPAPARVVHVAPHVKPTLAHVESDLVTAHTRPMKKDQKEPVRKVPKTKHVKL